LARGPASEFASAAEACPAASAVVPTNAQTVENRAQSAIKSLPPDDLSAEASPTSSDSFALADRKAASPGPFQEEYLERVGSFSRMKPGYIPDYPCCWEHRAPQRIGPMNGHPAGNAVREVYAKSDGGPAEV
jgi:hypothetical protein